MVKQLRPLSGPQFSHGSKAGERGLVISKILLCSKILCSVAVQQEVVKHWPLPRKAIGYCSLKGLAVHLQGCLSNEVGQNGPARY